MEIPKNGWRSSTKKRCTVFGLLAGDRLEERGPLLRENGESAEPALRMIERTSAAQAPEFCRQDKSLHFIAMRPPAVPEHSHVGAGSLRIDSEVGGLKKAGYAKERRLDVIRRFGQRRERQPLREERKRELVLFVAQRGGDFLKERGVAAVVSTIFGGEPPSAGADCARREDRLQLSCDKSFSGAWQRPGRASGTFAENCRTNVAGSTELRHVSVRFGG